jgi:hypothetical protein
MMLCAAKLSIVALPLVVPSPAKVSQFQAQAVASDVAAAAMHCVCTRAPLQIIYIATIMYNYENINQRYGYSNTPYLLLGSILGANRQDLTVNRHGIPDLAVTILLLVFAAFARRAEKLAVDSIDEAQQTPQGWLL